MLTSTAGGSGQTAGQPEISAARVSTLTQRVMSVDALRGLDMFFIVGMEEIFEALSEMFPMTPSLNDRVQHAPWSGFHFYDLIFPLFAFIIGVSLVFSLSKSMATEGRPATTCKIIKRSVILYLLGILYYGGISAGIDHVRLLGVLQRLALCFCAAGLAFVWLSPRKLVALTVTLLMGYWAMLTFVPVPGFGAGDFAEGHNLTNWVDKMYLPFRKWDGDHDPEGILSTLPAIATTLLGALAGMLLKNPGVEPIRKVRLLAFWGGAGIVLGLLWHFQFPIIKKIWTSSFVLYTGGISTLLLALFYYVIDVRQHRAWCQPFVWIGMNAITIYLVCHFVKLGPIAQCFVGGGIRAALEKVHQGLGDFAVALLALFFSVLICRFLFVRKIFLRV
jgi:predicted acyltransferase